MTQAGPRREKPAPLTPEEDAELEAKYRLLFRRLRRYAARMKAKDPDYFERLRREQAESQGAAPLTGRADPARKMA